MLTNNKLGMVAWFAAATYEMPQDSNHTSKDCFLFCKDMIRPYRLEDRERLIEIMKLNIPRYFHPAEERDFADYLDNHLEDYYVVAEHAQIVGAGGINYLANGSEARISWDVIHPDFQGKGLGRELTLFRINRIKEHPTIRQITVRTSQMAFTFYQKLGFEVVEVEKDYWAEGFDLYVMSLHID